MEIEGVRIRNTYAEAFPMHGCRVIVTAAETYWVDVAAREATGYASSVIGCDAEAGIERRLEPCETPDGRPGIALLFFAFNRESLEKAVVGRVGQAVMTCPTTSCYSGLPIGDKFIVVGGKLRFFGDGWQISKLLDGTRYWRLPVMDGEFVCQESFGTQKGVAGGNFLILAESRASALNAARAAVEAIAAAPDAILPFPGGIVRSGSKVGSKYKTLKASTNEAYCPTLKGVVDTAVPHDVHAVYEIVIDGLTQAAVENAMRIGIRAACRPGVVEITAGNYGGTLGPYLLQLHTILQN